MSRDENSLNSTSANPDLNWSQVRETVLMLKLAASQVEFSLKDGGSSVDSLTESFTAMAGNIRAIESNVSKLFEQYSVEAVDQQIITTNCQQVAEKMQQAIVAFQFYDTLVQRLDHVVNSLSNLGELVSEPSRLYSPAEWCSLQQTIRSGYNMAKERELFDAIIAGEDMAQVLERMHQVAINEQDDIELF